MLNSAEPFLEEVLMEDSFVLMLKSCAVNCYDMLFIMLRRFARR